MANKKFMDLSVGEKFTLNGLEYEKIPDERISCCRVNNAQQINSGEKIQIIPIEEVSVND